MHMYMCLSMCACLCVLHMFMSVHECMWEVVPVWGQQEVYGNYVCFPHNFS